MQMPATMTASGASGGARRAGRIRRSDAGAEAAGAADGHRLAQVSRGMEEGDAAQEHRARPPGERLHERLGPRAERAGGRGALDGGGLRGAGPVLGPESADDLASAAADRVAVL